jgi:hypothetical protein
MKFMQKKGPVLPGPESQNRRRNGLWEELDCCDAQTLAWLVMMETRVKFREFLDTLGK